MADPIYVDLPTYRPTGAPYHYYFLDWSTAPIIVGSGGIWGDNTDDTYYEWTGQTRITEYFGGTYEETDFNLVGAKFSTIDLAAYNPNGWVSALYIPQDGLRIRLKATGTNPLFVYLYEYDGVNPPPYYNAYLRYNNIYPIPNTVTTVTPTVLTDNMGDIGYFAQQDTLNIWLSFGQDARYDWVTVYDVWIEGAYLVLYPPNEPIATGLPPLRQVQRGDALGVGGVPRALQTSSRQASLRSGTSFI